MRLGAWLFSVYLPQRAEMLSPGLWSGYTSVGFECCMGLDLQREEFYPSINMLCHGRSCSLGLTGAWEKLSIHIISNVGTCGLVMPSLPVHVGCSVHTLSNNFQRGSKSKNIACISWAPTQGCCLHWSSLKEQAEMVPAVRMAVRLVNTCSAWWGWDHGRLQQRSSCDNFQSPVISMWEAPSHCPPGHCSGVCSMSYCAAGMSFPFPWRRGWAMDQGCWQLRAVDLPAHSLCFLEWRYRVCLPWLNDEHI